MKSEVPITERLLSVAGHEPKLTKADHTRAKILDTAYRFLLVHPFRELTVNCLMRVTPFSRTVFYRYFDDIQGVMETLLKGLKSEIFAMTGPWYFENGDPIALLHQTLKNEVQFCHECAPFLKAVSDAAGNDDRLETAWSQFLLEFDGAVCDRIAADQQLGLINAFDPMPVATSLVRLDAYSYINSFGQKPKRSPEDVINANSRIWISTLYGQRWVKSQKSTLVRSQ